MDMEICARVERRRRWTAQEKAALLAEIDAEDGRVRLVARRHRVAESLLYNWRAARKAASVMMPSSLGTTFIPLGLLGDPRHVNQRHWPGRRTILPARSGLCCRAVRVSALTHW